MISSSFEAWISFGHRHPVSSGPRSTSLILIVIAVYCGVLALPAGSQDAELRVGYAQTDITPPVGGRTTGYRGAPPTEGVHDPLTARVLVMQSDQTTVALAVWDLCVFNSPWLHEEVRVLGFDHFLLANTHTHAGPDLDQRDFPSREDPWRRTVEKRVLETVRQARDRLFPASVAAGTGHLQLGYNRLVRQPEGHAITHFENPDRIPYGPVDPTVSVVRFTDDSGSVRVVLVHYACHPVVLGPKNCQLSADYPGVTRRLVEEKLGDGAACVFLQGAGGDINPLMLARAGDPQHDFPVVERVGTLLGQEVLRTLERMVSVPGPAGGLACASQVFNVSHRFAANESVTVGVTALLLNDEIGLVTMPGEPFVWFQTHLRERAGLPHALLLGYCSNGGYSWPAYLPDLESAARGGYGASDTTQAEVGTGERLLNQGLVQLYQLRGRLKSQPQRHLSE